MLSTDQLRIRAIVLDYTAYLWANGVDTPAIRRAANLVTLSNGPQYLLTSIRALASAVLLVRGVPSPLLTAEIAELRGTMSMLDLVHAKDEEGLASMEARAESGEVIRIV